MTTQTYAFPEAQRYDWLLLLTRMLGASLLIGLCAQISIPLPFTPVPITGQTLAVMCVGGMLGSRRGALTVVLYLIQSVMGLPVLAGGRVDPLALLGPTGGYLFGFILLAYIVGWLTERKARFGKSGLLAGLVFATTLHLFIGAAWLGYFVGVSNAFAMGMLPFIPGDIIKSYAVFTLLSRK